VLTECADAGRDDRADRGHRVRCQYGAFADADPGQHDGVHADNRLRGVCIGTGQSTDAAYYLGRPVVTGDLHGQAALLWTAAELLRRS